MALLNIYLAIFISDSVYVCVRVRVVPHASNKLASKRQTF